MLGYIHERCMDINYLFYSRFNQRHDDRRIIQKAKTNSHNVNEMFQYCPIRFLQRSALYSQTDLMSKNINKNESLTPAHR